jgi:hypothetical protein
VRAAAADERWSTFASRYIVDGYRRQTSQNGALRAGLVITPKLELLEHISGLRAVRWGHVQKIDT